MVKSRAQLTLDPNTHQKAKDVYDNLSERVNELIQADLDISQVDDADMVKDEVEDLEEEKQELLQEKDDLEKEIERVESELSTARATLKRLERKEDKKSDVLAHLEDKIEKGIIEKPDEIPSYHRENLPEMTPEEMWEKARGEEA